MPFNEWLESHDQRRTVLLEVDYLKDGTQGTLYLSNRPFTSYPADTPSNTAYEDVILSGLRYSRTINGVTTGEFRSQVTNVRLAATEEIQEARSFEYASQSVRVYLGDERWTRNEYVLIAKLTAVSITEVSRGTYQLDLLTASIDVDVPINEGTIETGNNQGRTLPILLGDCLNVSPLREDDNGLTWNIADAPITIGEVRVDNTPVAATRDNNNAKITFSSPPAGRVTLDAISQEGFTLRVVLRSLLDKLGVQRDDASINKLPDIPVGLFSTRATTYRQAFNSLLSSVGAYWGFNRLGIFTVGVIALPTDFPIASLLTPDDIALDGVRFVSRIQPVKEVALLYDVNNTPQTERPEEGLTARGSNLGIETVYPDAIVRETGSLIRTLPAATTEMNRRRLFRNQPRLIYSVSCFAVPFDFNLGDEISIHYPHFGFKDGINGIVVNISDSPLRGESTIEVLLNG